MLRLETRLIRRLAPAAVCALAIAGCGSTGKPTTKTSTMTTTPGGGSSTVAIYSSLPESGAYAARSRQIETGIELALKLAHDKAGAFKIVYTHLCDTTPPARRRSHAPTSRGKLSPAARTSSHSCTGNWNATAVADKAEEAARNPDTVAYIGDLNSGATELSLPILNQAGIVQITPGSGYVGLTNSVTIKNPKGIGPITQPDEPGIYYPRGLDNRTFLRMIPNDLVQASAALDVLHKAGCQKVSAWNFGTDTESKSLFNAVIATAPRYQMDYVAPPALSAKTDYISYAHALGGPNGIRCAVLVGHVTKAAESLTLELREQLSPAPTIVGTAGFCVRDWLQGIASEYRKDVAEVLSCTTPERPVDTYTGYARFVALFESHFHRQPTTFDLYGYAAAEMLLQALIDSDSPHADVREQVLTNMVEDFAPNEVENTAGQIHAFSFDSYGNLLDNYNYYGVDSFKHGTPQSAGYVRVAPKHLLSSG